MKKQQYKMRVLINGRPVREYERPSDRSVFIEGREGTEYEIEIKNSSSKRILAVVSVDGLNVINGEVASPDSVGYIVGSFSSTKIKGFRYDEKTVGTFKFAKKTESYAASKGEEQNCGVVSVIFFEEKAERKRHPFANFSKPLPPYIPPRSRPNPFESPWTSPSIPNPYRFDNPIIVTCDTNVGATRSLGLKCETKNSNFGLGTSWGAKLMQETQEETFQRGGEVYSSNIYYTDRGGLVALGIDLSEKQQIEKLPQGFPKKYAVPPANWA